MRQSIFALTALAGIVAVAPERAYAGDPEADKRIYDAFQKYMQTVSDDKKEQEYKKFLEWYPTNTYAPNVKKDYEAFLARKTTTPPQNSSNQEMSTNSNNTSSQGGYGISTSGTPPKTDPIDPMEEAAGAVGATEDDAAAALGGSVIVAEPTPVVRPITDTRPVTVHLRRPKSFGIGADFALSAFVGPGFLVDYTTMTGRWTVGGAVRFPAFQTVQAAFEARRFLTPERPISGYLGGTMSSVSGNIENVLSLVDVDFPGTNATSATVFGALAGVQKMNIDSRAYYLELSYQFLISDTGDQAGFPGASLGFRYFFR